MIRQALSRRALALVFFASLSLAGIATADELTVVTSGGFSAAIHTLAPEFQRQTGIALVTEAGPSMGNTTQAVPQRLARHESIDVVLMVGDALGQLVDKGEVTAASRVDLARSAIGIAVKAGTPHPAIDSPDALKRTLLDAKSIAYSDSASGVYVSSVLFKRLGIAEAMHGKARMIPAEPVGSVVARGDAELGFQQISELKPVAGIDIVGPLPDSLQKYTVYSAGIVAGSQHAASAHKLIAFLASSAAQAAIEQSGLEPIASPAK